ncbi:MAG TPA: hypothetical protein VK699_08470 [Terriglobales bacterium]|jgi:hypothetical protein|nr:hypothetical protein [Terriglobales bacterium]
MAQSQLLEPPIQTSTSNTSRPALVAAIGTVSFATLLLELSLTRLFSVVLFYHFAFLAISVALLGLGAGGVFAYIRCEQLKRHTTESLAPRIVMASALMIMVLLEVVLRVPVTLRLDWTNFFRLTIIYLVAAVPFFFTGLLFSLVFARERQRISQLYGADLIGGALACLAVVLLLSWIGGPNAILFAAMAMAAAGALWSPANRKKPLLLACLPLLLIIINMATHGRVADIVYAKGMRRSRAWTEYSKWNAISRVEVDHAGDARTIVIDADASTSLMHADPALWHDLEWQKDLMSAAPSAVNALRPHGDYAIIGPGGGVDVLRALVGGSPSVTAIEINPIIANNIMRGRYADYAYHLYERPEVHLHVNDGRSFIRNSQDQYDVLQMTLVDTWASTAAGTFALSENNLYTVEAFREYFDHLKPDGMIAITRWEFREPREALRVVSQAIETLRQMGVEDPRNHFIVVADGELNTDGRPVTVLVKKAPFTPQEVQTVLAHINETGNLHLVHAAHLFGPVLNKDTCRKSLALTSCYSGEEALGPVSYAAKEARQPFDELIDADPDVTMTTPKDPPAVSWSARDAFIAQYPYNIKPVSDNAPFFFFTFKTGRLLQGFLNPRSHFGIDWKVNLGVAVLFMLLGISALAVLAFLVLPLAFHTSARVAGVRPLLYFIAVGLGYILVEITMIQRFVLFLGHPTYALTVVVFLMMLTSGAGSLAARHWIADWRRVRFPLLIIAAALTAYIFLLPKVLVAWVGWPLGLKLLVSAVMLAPVGFLMGMPFPTGLRALENTEAGAIEWAWAMNAAASVLGSVLAMVIAVHFGMAATLACGAIAYLAAMMLVRALQSRAPAY